MKKLNEQIIKTLKNNGFTIGEITEQDDGTYVELNQSTPLGEDWWTTIWFDGTNEGFVHSVTKYYYDFDVDEEVEPYIRIRGQHGVPNSIRDLLEDAEWKDKKLDQLSDDLVNLDFDEDEEEEDL